MKEQNNIESNMSELEEFSKLKSLKNRSPFTTPDSFFDNLEEDIMTSISAESTAKIVKLNYRKLFIYAAAASIVALFVFITIQNTGDHSNQPNIAKQIIEKSNNNNAIANSKKPTDQLKNESIDIIIDEDSSYSTKQNIAQRDNTIKSQESTKPDNPKNINSPTHKNQEINIRDIEQNNNIDYVQNNSNLSPGSNGSQIISPVNNSENDLAISTARKAVNKLLDLGEDICTNKPAYLNAKINYKSKVSYLWSTDDTTAAITAKSNGTYWVNIMDVKGNYLASDTIKVKITPSPRPDLGNDQEICNYESILISSGCKNKEYRYEWSISDANAAEVYLSNLEPGNHTIELKVISCADTAYSSLNLYVKDCNLKIPNVITPNGDGKNDRFFIIGLNNYPNTQVYIMDRNGQVVYESLDYQNNWDASNMLEGTYFYRIKLGDENNTEKAGILSIIRK